MSEFGKWLDDDLREFGPGLSTARAQRAWDAATAEVEMKYQSDPQYEQRYIQGLEDATAKAAEKMPCGHARANLIVGPRCPMQHEHTRENCGETCSVCAELAATEEKWRDECRDLSEDIQNLEGQEAMFREHEKAAVAAVVESAVEVVTSAPFGLVDGHIRQLLESIVIDIRSLATQEHGALERALAQARREEAVQWLAHSASNKTNATWVHKRIAELARAARGEVREGEGNEKCD